MDSSSEPRCPVSGLSCPFRKRDRTVQAKQDEQDANRTPNRTTQYTHSARLERIRAMCPDTWRMAVDLDDDNRGQEEKA